jgi:hypothetical protein
VWGVSNDAWLSMVILDALVVVLTVKLAQDAPHWGEPNRTGAPCKIGFFLKKGPNFKLNSNFNLMKMKMGR